MATKKYISFGNLTNFLDNLKSLFATKTEMNSKSDKTHTHSISNVSDLQAALDGKVPTSRTINGKALSANITLSASDVGADAAGTAQTKVDAALASAKSYADSAATKVKNDLLNNAGTAYDTLKELGDLIDENTDAIDALETVASGKADKSHTHDDRYYTETEIDNKISTLNSTIAGKANSSHNHAISNITNLQTSLDAKVPTSRTINGKALSANITLSASDVGASASGHTHSYLPLGGGNLTGNLGIGNKYELSPAYNYTNGCLIDIGAAKSSTMVVIHITGNSYNSSTSPIDSLFQFYDYGDGTIMNYSGVNLGLALGAMTAYRHNNRLYAYIKQTGDYQTLSFTIITNKSGLSPTVTNATAHTSGYTDLATITPKNVSFNGHTHNYAGSSSAGGAATSAIKATQDASGNVITSTYATKSELDSAKSTLQTSINGKANSSHTHTIANITNLQTTLDGKAASSHTHSYAGSSSVGGAATSANKVNKTLTVQLNGGATEGTNKFTFDGSAAKSINVTASSIGAASTSHTHDDRYYTETEIDGKVSTINNAIAGKANSSHTHTIANVTNLQATLDGKSSTSHTHNTTYIPDTRSNNQTPLWYISNYPNQVITEFKSTSTIGLSGPTYCELTTYVQWGNNSGGYPSQETIINGRIYTRYGTSDTAWSNWKTNIDSDNIASQSVASATSAASCTGNSATATKLQTARTIALGTGATGTATSFNGTGNITIPVTDIKESYLSWGGKNLVGYVSPVGAALSTEHSANRIAYLNPAAIKVEYSNNAGSTWTDSGLGNSAKINLVTTSNGVSVGSNATVTTNHRTRITLTGQDGTTGYVYTRPRKMLINVSTPHGLTVTVEAKTGVSGASWTTLGTYELSGWSGWNDIPIGISTFGGGTNQTGNYWYIRLTFANTSVNSTYATTKSSIIGLRLFGDTCWTRTSNMGETGHLYSYDSSQNATFPASVTAPTFSGSGVATLAEVKSYLGI